MTAHVPGALPRDWPEDFAHENGQYMCHCAECSERFFGHKRRRICKVCDNADRGFTPIPRISKDVTFLRIAYELAMQGTCVRRKVGCVFVDIRGHISATGWNGAARGQPHCLDSPCKGAFSPSGVDLHLCEAIHAEANAFGQCAALHEVHTVYSTASPCMDCTKLLLQTSAKRLVFLTGYAHADSQERWTRTSLRHALAGNTREWMHITPEACGYSGADIAKLGRALTSSPPPRND